MNVIRENADAAEPWQKQSPAEENSVGAHYFREGAGRFAQDL